LAGRVSLAACLLETFAHPFIPGSALMLYGARNGGVVAFELVRREEPRLVLRARTPGGHPVVGLGVHKVGRVVGGWAGSNGIAAARLQLDA
jgi:hypothetical protein